MSFICVGSFLGTMLNVLKLMNNVNKATLMIRYAHMDFSFSYGKRVTCHGENYITLTLQ